MPRSDFLLPLSREHHSALVLARAARKALDTNDQLACLEVLEKIETYWHAVMAVHFDKEEQLLQQASIMLHSDDVARIHFEHEQLRILADKSCSLDLPVRLGKFADLMAAHVRYEERVLFPLLERCFDKFLK
ncbi:MAG: hemerythrin domain-containing protein [Nitrosomonas sp. PRO4]|nr:hemerythrin domain-containing protein [Nitrosomonas sp. PRO4]